ncbi:MAG TPA: VWA domain-containing protein [Spirochaetota bacterium]|nr:VWA domain-containing protein [Spirochaetota bacterium]HOV09873.1 VWA domain-containing protein [Spirochaetota bacterium]HPX91566.1 VWA domain-containing protein [Spirochaetota bacterium]
MKKIFYIFFLSMILFPCWLYSESIVVMPYRIEPPLDKISGDDYAKMLSLAIMFTKDIDVVNPSEVSLAMEMLGIRPEKEITAEHLHSLGLRCRAEYVLIGILKKSKGVYYYENVLYSVRNDDILSRNSGKAKDLYSIVHQEIRDTLINLRDIKSITPKAKADVAIILDSSYSMSSEIDTVRNSITEFIGELIGKYGIDTRVYLIPSSDNRSFESMTMHQNSIKELRQRLDNIKPSGTAKADTILRSLTYAIENIRWRGDASKDIVVINNSEVNKIFLAEQYAKKAKDRNIRISIISGGRVGGDLSDLDRLSELTDGFDSAISYHQRLFDPQGNSYEIYLQRGRVFYSLGEYKFWRDGILSRKGKNTQYVKTPEYFEELYTAKVKPWPENLAQFFSTAKGISIGEKNPLQSNIANIFDELKNYGFKKDSSFYYGKALISDGNISLWVRIRDRDVLEKFLSYSQRGILVKCGFTVSIAEGEPYGITLTPVASDITSDYITDFVRTSLIDIVKNKDYYMTKGIGRPPVWFINVKIENVESYIHAKDIRD